MKRIVSFFLILCLLSLSLASCALFGGDDEEQTGKPMAALYSKGLAYEAVEGDPTKCIITGIGSCTDKEIVIPTYINGMLVVGIADGAFSPRAETLKAASLDRRLAAATPTSEATTPTPEAPVITGSSYATVVTPSYQFGGIIYESYVQQQPDKGEGYETGTGTPIDLEEIESVTIPPSVKEIGDEAFYGCEELESIDTHTQAILSAIGRDAFKETAYYNNAQNWEGQALYLGRYLLNVSENFDGEFTVKEGTKIIASYAFYNCDSMTSVTMASSVSYIGNYAFSGCDAITSFYTTGEINYSYAANAFAGCYYFSTLPGQGGTGIPGFGSTEEKYPSKFDTISEADFERIKAAHPDVYTCEIQRGEGTDFFKTNGTTSHYTETRDGVITRELYADTDENGLVMYMKTSDGLYFTTATMPDLYAILEEISYDELIPEETTGNLYFYEEGGTRLQIGFKDGKLRIVNFLVSGQSIQMWFYDFDKTQVPDRPMADFVPGVTLDENGNRR